MLKVMFGQLLLSVFTFVFERGLLLRCVRVRVHINYTRVSRNLSARDVHMQSMFAIRKKRKFKNDCIPLVTHTHTVLRSLSTALFFFYLFCYTQHNPARCQKLSFQIVFAYLTSTYHSKRTSYLRVSLALLSTNIRP